MNPTLRVAIVGGGIAGPALALALNRMDREQRVKIDIYEAASELSQIGAGMMVWPRAWEVLTNLGISNELEQHLDRPPNKEPCLAFQFRKSDQQAGFTTGSVYLKGGGKAFHRAEIQKALMREGAQNYQYHLSHRLVSYEETSTAVILNFQNGFEARCDLLVGADGIRSTVRKRFIMDKCPEERQSINPIWSGTMVYRELCDSTTLARIWPEHRALTKPMTYCGKNMHIISYPIMKGRIINIAVFCSEPEKEGTEPQIPKEDGKFKEFLLTKFANWEPEARALLESMEKPHCLAIEALRPLKLYAAGRVALIGDSAHAMDPHLGAGAGQAFEDAYILATILANSPRGNIDVDRAIGIYSAVRQPVGNFVLNSSRVCGKLVEFRVAGLEAFCENEDITLDMLEKLNEVIEIFFLWAEKTSAEEDCYKALRMLKVNSSRFKVQL